jgi:hypothetical protein
MHLHVVVRGDSKQHADRLSQYETTVQQGRKITLIAPLFGIIGSYNSLLNVEDENCVMSTQLFMQQIEHIANAMISDRQVCIFKINQK